MKNQEQQYIISQLKSIRQESLTEYLGTSLQSLANKEVIEDVLKRFLSLHQDQFLANISHSIIEVKEENRSIKKQLKQRQQKEALIAKKVEKDISERFEQDLEAFKNKLVAIGDACEKVSGEKDPIKAIQKWSYLQELQKQKLLQQRSIKQKFMQQSSQKQDKLNRMAIQIKDKTNQINDKIIEIQKLSNQIKSISELVKQKQQLNRSLQSKIEEFSNSFKQLETKFINSKQMMSFLQDKACKMREDNIKLKHEINLTEKAKEKFQVQIKAIKAECANLIRQRQNLLENQKKQTDTINFLESRLGSVSSESSSQQDKNRILQDSITQLKLVLAESQTIVSTLKQEKNQLSNTISNLSDEKQHINRLLSQQRERNEKLKSIINEKESQMKSYIQKKDEQINSIHEELNEIKKQLEEKEDQEQQYQLYFQQIIELKQKIKKLTPNKYQPQIQLDFYGRPTKIRNKRSKIYFLLTQLTARFVLLQKNKIELKNYIDVQIKQIKDYANKVIEMISAKVLEFKLQCDYCDHKKLIHQQPILATLQQTHQNGRVKSQKNFANQLVILNWGNFDHKTYQNHKQNSASIYRHVNQEQFSRTKQLPSYNSILQQQRMAYPTTEITQKTVKTNSKNMTIRNVQKLNQKMKVINHENSSYQVHLSRVLSQSNLQ